MAVGDLDLDWDRRSDADLSLLAYDSCPPGHPGAIVTNDREDRGRVHVHSSHDEHVVAAPKDAHAECRPLACARGSLDSHDVRPAEPHHRHRLSRQGRVDELTDRAGLDLHRLQGLRVDQLGPDVSPPAEVPALLVRACLLYT